MSGLNKVMLIGNLCRDPEMRFAKSDLPVCNFSLATSEKWKDKTSGDKKEKTEYHNISAFGKLAEICGKYLKQGSQVYVEGKLQTNRWEKDGVTRYTTGIVIHEMKMLGKKSGGGEKRQEQQEQGQPDGTDSEVPF